MVPGKNKPLNWSDRKFARVCHRFERSVALDWLLRLRGGRRRVWHATRVCKLFETERGPNTFETVSNRTPPCLQPSQEVIGSGRVGETLLHRPETLLHRAEKVRNTNSKLAV